MEKNQRELHFDVDLAFLLIFSIQKEYETQTEEASEETKHQKWFPAWERFAQMQEENHDFIADYTEFITDILKIQQNIITVTSESLQIFAHWWWQSKMMSDEGFLEQSATIQQNIRMAQRKREFYEDWSYDSGIWNKETDKFIPARFGDHWDTIYQQLVQKFGRKYLREKENWPTCDAWIQKNIELKGNCNGDSTYTIQSKAKIYGDWLMDLMDKEE